MLLKFAVAYLACHLMERLKFSELANPILIFMFPTAPEKELRLYKPSDAVLVMCGCTRAHTAVELARRNIDMRAAMLLGAPQAATN